MSREAPIKLSPTPPALALNRNTTEIKRIQVLLTVGGYEKKYIEGLTKKNLIIHNSKFTA